MRRDSLRGLALVVAAACAAAACSKGNGTSRTADDKPDASAVEPAIAITGPPMSVLAIPHAHVFDSFAESDRSVVYERMEAMGAVAAGLFPDNDPDNRQAPFTRER